MKAYHKSFLLRKLYLCIRIHLISQASLNTSQHENRSHIVPSFTCHHSAHKKTRIDGSARLLPKEHCNKHHGYYYTGCFQSI